MTWRLVPIAIMGLVHLNSGRAVLSLQDLEVADDTHAVGSYVREVRAAPTGYHHSYENDGNGEIGYSRKKNGGGKKGYQHFDSYHKKAGDNFEFEKQDSFGHDDEEQKGAYSHQDERKEKYRVKPVAEKYIEQPSSSVEEEETEEGLEGSSEHDNSELREGESDGNGGKEDYGHDKSDYVLPDKYTYGGGDEYNF